MTQKQFITIIKDSFEDDSWEAILNTMSLYIGKARDYYRADGSPVLAEEAKDIAHNIYAELKKTGYYSKWDTAL